MVCERGSISSAFEPIPPFIVQAASLFRQSVAESASGKRRRVSRLRFEI
jgi:hypothetical protein